jgi:hypothetical protein
MDKTLGADSGIASPFDLLIPANHRIYLPIRIVIRNVKG